MVVDSILNDQGKVIPMHITQPIQIITPKIAQQMKEVLIKTVQKGTGTGAITAGLEVGGKTGTAHIAKNGGYSNTYHSSFVGFANDKTHAYTIGIFIINPKKGYFAADTAVPVFKGIVDMMVEQHYLVPDLNTTTPPKEKKYPTKGKEKPSHPHVVN
jgi:cell division protein FtsI (penicillin-binding protein 3)